jgi:peptidoglycan hydrolase CwlO-like protein
MAHHAHCVGNSACDFPAAVYNFYVRVEFGSGRVMPKVFLAYKTVDGERANVVRAKLEALAVPLFIDQKLVSGDNYLQAINDELNSAVAVLVLWSAAAVRMPGPGETNFVLSEAQKGYSRSVLVAATFERMALDHLPVPFNLFQAPDLSDWIANGASATHREWQKVLEALGRKLNRPGLPSLAIAIESDGDALKRKALMDYPDDPLALSIAKHLEAFERKEFETQFLAAKKRIQQRAKEAERKLNSCRGEFETQIAELRAGRNFMPPDPVESIEDRVGVLRNEIEACERTIDEERHRADRAEDFVGKISAEVAELKGRLTTHAVTLDARNAAIEQLNSNLAKRDEQIANHQSAIASHATEIARITEAAVMTRQESEAKGGRIGELETSITLLKQRLQGETKRLVIWSGAAAVMAACVFFFAGKSLAPTESSVQALNAKIINLSADNQALQTQASDAQRQASDLATQNQKLSSLVNNQNTQAADLKAQQDALSTKQTAFIKQQADLDKQAADLKAQQDALSTKQATFTKQQTDFTAQQNALATKQADIDKQAANLKAQQDALSTKQAAFAKQQADLDKQAADLKAQQDALSTKQAAFSKQQADLDKQAADLKAQQDALSTKQATFTKQQTDFTAQQNALATKQGDLDKQTAELKVQQDALSTKQAAFTKQQDDFTAQQNALAKQQAVSPSIPLDAQCDMLAAYQYDPDRPPYSGWVDSNSTIPNTAQTICESALQTVNDTKSRRRIILQIGRTRQDKEPEAAFKLWKQAADLGSSHAFYVFGRYYADRSKTNFNAKIAWDNIKRSADMGDPVALYSVAYNFLFPNDHSNILTPAQADPTAGEDYLRKALNADFSPAYYIAGAHYWDKNNQTASNYLIISSCIKHDKDADKFYQAKTGRPLTCQ